MERSTVLVSRARRRLGVEVVHDLRTSLRRVRSLCGGLNETSPDDAFAAADQAARPLFRGLADLRDAHVLTAHVKDLCKDDLLRDRLLAMLDDRARGHRAAARAAVVAFDVPRWRALTIEAPLKAFPLLTRHALFEHLALRRLHEAKLLHRAALRNRTSVSAHALRIGVKKLRYVFESFLPEQHAAVGADLKKLQAWLGDLHDLDVLKETLRAPPDSVDEAAVRALITVVDRDRAKMMRKYREHAIGKGAAWTRIEAALPRGTARDAIVVEGARAWASRYGGADEAAAIAAVAELAAAPTQRTAALDARARRVLSVAALCRGLAKDDDGAPRPKKSARRLARFPPCAGFDERDVALACAVVRGDDDVDERDRALRDVLVAALAATTPVAP